VFIAIGPAVNEAARLEELTKRLGEPVVASAAFALQCGLGAWRLLGNHDLCGLGCCQEIFVSGETGEGQPAPGLTAGSVGTAERAMPASMQP
jgi:adenylate cyclase